VFAAAAVAASLGCRLVTDLPGCELLRDPFRDQHHHVPVHALDLRDLLCGRQLSVPQGRFQQRQSRSKPCQRVCMSMRKRWLLEGE
jgi:hypothetical protein